MVFSEYIYPIIRGFFIGMVITMAKFFGYDAEVHQWIGGGVFFDLLPVVIPVMGSIIAVSVGIKIFKKVTGR